MSVDYSLYLVTDSAQAGGVDRVPAVVAEAIAGGVTVVQVRDKLIDDKTFTRLLLAVDEIARPAGVPVFVNDRVHLAARHGFHVHIGQADGSVAQAREALGPDLLIGLSAGTEAEVDAAVSSETRPDLLGIGPVFPTSTKLDAGPALGIERLDRLATRAAEHGIPAVGIGGITAGSINGVRSTSAVGACVVSAIMTADDPKAAARELREA